MARMKVSQFEDFVEGNAKIGIDNLNYSIIGLCGEAGEVAEWYKKSIIRGNKSFTNEMLKSELGDVLHYVTRIALNYDWDLKEIMADNVDKLEARNGKG